MKIKFAIFSLLLIGLLPVSGRSQVALSLEQCMELALESNIQLRQSGNAVTLEEIGVVRSKFDFLPGVSAGVSGSKNFGQTVDNFTQSIAQSPITMNMNLGTSLVLFRGLSKWNELRRTENTLKAAEYSLEDLKNDVRLNVALAFFNATFGKDNLKIAENNLELLKKQYERAEKLLRAEASTEGDLYAVEAEIARAKSALVTAENNYQRALLDLILVLNADPSKNYDLLRPDLAEIDLDADIQSGEVIYDFARENNPAVREQQMRIIAAKYAMQAAKAPYYPTVTVNYGVFSFYSSNARPLDSVSFAGGEIEQFFGPRTPFQTQFSDNLSHAVTLGVSIPIFSNYASRHSYLRAKLNYENVQLNHDNAQNELYRAIMQARQDAVAAQAQYRANQEQLVSLNKALEYAEKKYEAGVMDFYSLREFINNKTSADVDLVRSQYDYVLKIKVLDLYEGKELRF
jgi:outer membrane protein